MFVQYKVIFTEVTIAKLQTTVKMNNKNQQTGLLEVVPARVGACKPNK